jgi:hypothetical protein
MPGRVCRKEMRQLHFPWRVHPFCSKGIPMPGRGNRMGMRRLHLLCINGIPMPDRVGRVGMRQLHFPWRLHLCL